MNKIAQLTAGPQICEALVAMGIKPRAFFWHVMEVVENKAVLDVWEVENPEFKPGEVIPAWTKEELDIMIGGDMPKPDLLPKQHVTVLSKAGGQPYYAYKYVHYDINRILSWEPTLLVINPGAKASAEMLKISIEKHISTIAEINDRYAYFFKP